MITVMPKRNAVAPLYSKSNPRSSWVARTRRAMTIYGGYEIQTAR